MNAYLDSSVLLRKILAEAEPLAEWGQIEQAHSSYLITVEVARVIQRYRLAGQASDQQVAKLYEAASRLMRSIERLALSESILDRAAGPMPTSIGSLDAIHLATALELQRVRARPITLATHDVQLARAATASGLDVIGVPR